MAENPLCVTAALLRHDHKILIAQRNNSGRFANKWEFPGGKIDPGETPQQALHRELQEELGLETSIGALFSDTLYTHEQGKIRQFTYWVDFITAPINVELSEHQAIAWVSPVEIVNYEFAGADLAVVEKLHRENPSIF
jgi:8-oxo-dGTP diphosphatase